MSPRAAQSAASTRPGAIPKLVRVDSHLPTRRRADVGVTLNVYAAAFEGHAEALAGRLDAIRAAAVRP